MLIALQRIEVNSLECKMEFCTCAIILIALQRIRDKLSGVQNGILHTPEKARVGWSERSELQQLVTARLEFSNAHSNLRGLVTAFSSSLAVSCCRK
jgi:hypothetical protein